MLPLCIKLLLKLFWSVHFHCEANFHHMLGWWMHLNCTRHKPRVLWQQILVAVMDLMHLQKNLPPVSLFFPLPLVRPYKLCNFKMSTNEFGGTPGHSLAAKSNTVVSQSKCNMNLVWVTPIFIKNKLWNEHDNDLCYCSLGKDDEKVVFHQIRSMLKT